MQSFSLPKGERKPQIDRIARFLGVLSKEKAWSIEVKEIQRKRTDQQNRYLWGVCYPEIAKHLEGWELDDIHEYCLGECYGWEQIQGFGYKRIRPLKRSSRMSVTEFMDYVAWIQRNMAEKGIFIPDPEAM